MLDGRVQVAIDTNIKYFSQFFKNIKLPHKMSNKFENLPTQSKHSKMSMDFTPQSVKLSNLSVCLFAHMFHCFIRMTEYFIYNFAQTFNALHWQSQAQSILDIFAHLCFFMFLYFLTTCRHFLIKFCTNVLGITVLKKPFLPANFNTYNMNNNLKNNILLPENTRQKRLAILEYFDAYFSHIINLKPMFLGC